MDYRWMPWNVEGTCSLTYNENLPSQVVDYENEHHLGFEHSFPIKCQRCGVIGHDRTSCTKPQTFGESLEAFRNEFFPQHLDHSSQSYAQEPNNFYLDPFHSHPYQDPLSYSNEVECPYSWDRNGYERDFDQHDVPLDSSPSLTFGEGLKAWTKKLREFNASFDKKIENSHTLDKSASTFGEENEENKESKVLCELEELSSEHLLVKSASNLTFPTLASPPSQEEEHIVVKSFSTSCDEKKGSELIDMLNELENMSIEELINLVSSTDPSLIPQLSQEVKMKQPSIGEVDEEPHEVVTPIQLDENDLSIFNELVHQVECCYMYEITNEWEPQKMEPGVGSNEMHEDNEWFKLEFIEDITTLSLQGKFYPSPSIVSYKRFLTFEEISFFWYRDGYSDNL